MRRSFAILTATLATATVALTACGAGTDEPTTGVPSIVTSTNVWGSVATAVAGDKATVAPLFNTAEGDPHEFSPSASDTARITNASIVVVNGGHYDEYLEAAPKGPGATVINAFDQLPPAPAGTKVGEVNEHVFYNLTVVAAVANKIADALAKAEPSQASTFRDNAKNFTGRLNGLSNRLAEIKQRRGGSNVIQTEPLAGYLLEQAGLIDIAPTGFTAAVEEGQSPSAADRAAFEDRLTKPDTRALLYNTQAVDSVTEAMLGVAGRSGVSVVRLTETLPAGVTDYVTWQTAQIDALQAGIGA